MRFPELVYRNLARRPARTALTVAALATALTAIISLLGVCKGFKRAFGDVYAAHGIDIVVSRQGSADRLSSAVEAPLIDRISALPCVDRVAGVLLETLSLEQEGVYGLPTMGLKRDSWLLADYETDADRKGASIGFTDGGDREVLVGLNLARRLGIGAGERLQLFDESFLVVGVFRSRSVWENGSLILPLEDLQRLTGRQDQVTYINVVLRRAPQPVDMTGATTAIEALDPRLLAMATSDFVSTDNRLRLADAMAWMTSLVAIAIGGFGTLNTMMTSVHERTREIGILRAIGWPPRRIMLMILLESFGLASISVAIGGLLSVCFVWLLRQSPVAAGILVPVVDLPIFIQALSMGVGIGLLGAWIPARRASRLQPIVAFRDDR
jgi:putative ABC transport system permease protein